MKIVLAICTYRRPAGLQHLLNTLPTLQLNNDLDNGSFEIVVIDNDTAGEGLAVCQSLDNHYPFAVHAAIEPTAGLSAARNTATTKALSLQPDLVAFLDDDEWPEPQWLAELIRIQKHYGADLVGGPTRPVFPDHAPTELTGNPYYGADMGLDDGAACQLQAGGNFLARAAVLERYAPQYFDPAFSRSGSEDLAFFTRLAQDGCRMHWATEAIVHEPVPESRLQPQWLRQRVINIHNSRVRVMQNLHPDIPSKILRIAKTCVLMAQTTLLQLAAFVWPKYRTEAKLLRWKLIGKLTAHAGRITSRKETY